MKISERAVWAIIAVGAFAAGMGLRGGKAETPEASAQVEAGATRHSSRDGHPGGGADATRGEENLPLSQRSVLAERAALSSPLRTGRFQGMMAVLDQVKEETWQGMWEEFKRQTTEDGRVHEIEWSLFMNRVGEVAGGQAMEFFEKNGQPQYTFNRREILRGWAAVDPEAAIRWMDSQPPESPNQELQTTLLEGVAQANPDRAINLLLGMSENQRAAGSLVSELIQAKGIQWTRERIDRETLNHGETPVCAAMKREVANRLSRMAWLAENP